MRGGDFWTCAISFDSPDRGVSAGDSWAGGGGLCEAGEGVEEGILNWIPATPARSDLRTRWDATPPEATRRTRGGCGGSRGAGVAG